MRNPWEDTDADETGCEGCGDPADVGVMVVGRAYPAPLCRSCQDDLLTVCPQCERTIWQADGKRSYGTASLYCKSCDEKIGQVPAAITDVDQVRR